jgi:hypothetical protein
MVFEIKQPKNEVPFRDLTIIRQNALAHADACFKHKLEVEGDVDLKEYFSFAEECEKWVLR